jgi:hypothetical protein
MNKIKEHAIKRILGMKKGSGSHAKAANPNI